MMTGTSVVIARHGQTVWHADNRYAGSSDVDLTPEGQRQADLLARWAVRTGPDVLVCSPLRRARDTAAPTARALGLEPVVREELREVDFGVAEGRTIDELRQDDPGMVDRFRDDPVTHHFPDADDPAHAARRAERALRDLAREYAGATVLVVAHNTLVRLALCRLLGIDVELYRTVFPRLDNGTLTRLTLPVTGDGPASLLSFNVPLHGGTDA